MDEVALRPGTGGVFVVEAWADHDPGEGRAPVVLWDRRRDGGFPEITELKRRVRDVVAPGKPLGHSDHVAASGDLAGDGAGETPRAADVPPETVER